MTARDEATRCRCHEGPEAWRWCPLPQHDHTKWTEHGWNCPASCSHPDAAEAHHDRDERATLADYFADWTYPTHRLKTVQPYFDAVMSGHKTFEVRKNDRSFQPGGLLILAEWTGSDFTGRECARKITYVLRDGHKFGVQPGFVVLGLAMP